MSRLRQTDIKYVLENDPADVGHMAGLYDVSIKKVLTPVWKAIGMVYADGEVIGTCSLISCNLALLACHSIEGQDITRLRVVFERIFYRGRTENGPSYPVECVVELDQELDYAIIKFQAFPGRLHGFLPIKKDVAPVSLPALLHYPLGRPLKVSVHEFVEVNYKTNLLSVFHDTDYGSSGGAYILPSGDFVALHLGSSRNQYTYNLHRYALPLREIIDLKAAGILARLASKDLSPTVAYSTRYLGNPFLFISVHHRVLIDYEKFIQANFIQAKGFYYLRRPTVRAPGVLIERYQGKHSFCWPEKFDGKKGTSLRLDLDTTIELAETLIDQDPLKTLFSCFHSRNQAPSIQRIPINQLPKKMEKKLLPAQSVNVYAAYDAPMSYWQIHFYPNK